ncbi:MAG: hypothetical protein NTV32_07380 [Gammaproteobacteria bacterium]|nr:hypothetical protein [Gammaproteobacteria bacterium]
MKKMLPLLLLAAPLFVQAERPPAYLSVSNFQQCLSQTQESTFTHWCLPAKKLAACPDASWTALQNMNLPAC